jgi:hypothetical protein
MRQAIVAMQAVWKRLTSMSGVRTSTLEPAPPAGELPIEDLVKIRADVDETYRADENGIEGESFWAEPLGDECYRLRNSAWYVYDLHFLDIVRAVRREPGQLPTIVGVVERSGHKTLRVLFDAVTPESEIRQTLTWLNDAAVNHEQAQGRFYALDARPEADFGAVCDELWRLEQAGRLHYETGSTD